MKKMCTTAILVLVIIGIYLTNVFFVTHSLKMELIDEIEYSDSARYSYGEKYFFIKDESYNSFYDGKAVLKNYLPEYDTSLLDTENFTYMVTVNRKIDSVKYNGRNCKRRTYFLLPDEYEALIESEETGDGIIRIYRTKKINIDYDYHSE